MDKETFDKIENLRGCGYWNVCDEHSCPCHPTAQVSQGYNEDLYKKMKKEMELDY